MLLENDDREQPVLIAKPPAPPTLLEFAWTTLPPVAKSFAGVLISRSGIRDEDGRGTSGYQAALWTWERPTCLLLVDIEGRGR